MVGKRIHIHDYNIVSTIIRAICGLSESDEILITRYEEMSDMVYIDFNGDGYGLSHKIKSDDFHAKYRQVVINNILKDQ